MRTIQDERAITARWRAARFTCRDLRGTPITDSRVYLTRPSRSRVIRRQITRTGGAASSR
jgi:hypothetical protein